MSSIIRSNPLATIGHVVSLFLASVGRLVLFTASIIGQGIRPPYYPKQIGRMIIEIGYYSLPVVGLTTLFTGAALALQSNSGFADMGAENSIPLIVSWWQGALARPLLRKSAPCA
jgi:phospholipid/cholesterol/gamma-HCH transport system permease protein